MSEVIKFNEALKKKRVHRGDEKAKVTREYLDEIIEKFGEKIRDVKQAAYNQWIITVEREDLPEIVLYFLNHPEWKETQLSSMVATDERPLNGKFSITYWLSVNGKAGDFYLGVRAYLPEDDPRFTSIAAKHRGANWYEREAMEMLGLTAEGHPDPRRLVLPDDWPSCVYPLRKDFHYSNSPPGEKFYPYKEPKKDEIVVPYGPYHVALEEAAHFRLYVKGETITDVDYRGFYAHRGIEKISEGRLTYDQVCFIAERICGICGCTHSTAYCQAVENAGGIEVPERAEYIRTIVLEIERLHSHLLNFGIVSHLVGYDYGFMKAWRIREHVMWLAERLTGNRKTYGMLLVGGVRRDLLEYRKSLIEDVLKKIKTEFSELVDEAISTSTFVKRLEGVGVLPYKVAKEWDVDGPLGRGSGRDFDVRRDHPYAAYKYLDFKVPVYKEGDVLARALVRIEEVFESIWIIEQALDQMPGGDILAEYKEIPPYSEAIGMTEAPRGENIHYVMTGENNKVYRYRARAATYNNLPAVPDMMRGYTIADAPLIVASIDPCYSCTERVQVVDVESGKVRVLSETEFNKLSIKASRRV
ncbi:Hydrogenase 4, component G or formate hydrogen lyase, subunit 5 [Thermococcus onnurineus NA1]|uniref:Hydrogenase 4, component G or formate hydrogen lyase, subunit 5 n=1 Tax=Thermococcus onnurineus (strain NA1) TaxID=523850 RepID=B6YTW8_THEON|nr:MULTISPECIES: NADH-quinone oxidoreductase subunit C [Thermococcus]ACJ17059.1 Hydrogenase 4, component G or formate hydrogen lyase, subunit 5 [Thermococcus onnurineus NA1]NJE46610.1 hydrogenase large subunit [Thermococcus sp. GR7]NJE77962.1 hydrogenase large subunit [Thermococcus sp. GR4]NJF23090.1 hydrogenase large subunit [Thermococcus sp. GR5]